MKPAEKEVTPKESGSAFTADLPQEDFYFPSVDLLTAQVLTQREAIFCHVIFKSCADQTEIRMVAQFSVQKSLRSLYFSFLLPLFV